MLERIEEDEEQDLHDQTHSSVHLTEDLELASSSGDRFISNKGEGVATMKVDSDQDPSDSEKSTRPARVKRKRAAIRVH